MNLDSRTFRLREIGFGNYRITVPENRAFFQQRVQLGAEFNNLLADISAGVDIATGRVTWTLTAIDPTTGEQPNSASLGLLPPNDETGRGQGFVTYTVLPKSTAPTGTVITNNATIIFDTEEPINTNTVTNTLDADAPASAVGALPATSEQTFTVSWAGDDPPGGSGLQSYDIWVAENDGPYQPFVSGTTETSAQFTGTQGRTYRFYSIARDNAGNVEATPTEPDAVTTVGDLPPNPTPTLTGLNPNSTPVGGSQFTLTITGTNFINGSTVHWNNSPRVTTYVSPTQLTATIPASDIANAGTANITVLNPSPGGGASNALTSTIGNPGGSDLAITKTHTGDFTVGTNGVYTITVNNVGLEPSSGTIIVTDTLPAGLSFVSGTGAGWTCSATGQDVTCMNADPLAAGASTSITLTVGVGSAASPSVVNTVNVSHPGDVNPANNTASDPTVVNNSTGLQYYPLSTPIRLLDTRPGQPACNAPGTPLVGGAVRTELARLTCGGVTIPANAQAIVGNATIVNDTPAAIGGFVTLYPSNTPRPTVSNLNYVAGQIVPNAFTVGLGGDGAFNIYATSGINFIVDVTGYYAPPGPGGLYYHPLPPQPIRLLDTRPGQPACDTPGTPLIGDAVRTELARLTCGGVTIPASAQVIVGNATVVNNTADSGSGFITLYPTGVTRPTVSNLNYTPDQIVPNAFTVALGSDGAFNIYASTQTNFIVDITGYYSDQAVDENGAGLLYYPLSSPVRLLDTRIGQPACDNPGAPLLGGTSRTEAARVTCSGVTIPANAQTIVGNATVVNNTGTDGGFITLYPSGATPPTVSNLNYAPGQVVPNAFTVGLGSDGAFNIFASSSTHFIADVTGYFAP